jgi:hypothetical protein
MQVFYRPVANDAVDFSPELLEGIRGGDDRRMAHPIVIRQATAFTHSRRIELLRVLSGATLDGEALVEKTGSGVPALLSPKCLRGAVVGNRIVLMRPSCQIKRPFVHFAHASAMDY